MWTLSRAGKLNPNQYAKKKIDMLLHQEREVLRWFVPRQNRLRLLRTFYDEQCHVGPEKTLERIKQHFWFPRL